MCNFHGLCPKSTAKAMGEPRINWGSKILLQLDHADDLKSFINFFSKINEFLEVLRVWGAKI